MRKGNKLILATLALSSIVITGNTTNMANAWTSSDPLMVDFFNNYLREDFTLSTGFKGRGNNIIYKTVYAVRGTTVEKPEDPTRTNYDFKGWYLEEGCKNEWDFATMKVEKNTRLFAKWEVSAKAAI